MSELEFQYSRVVELDGVKYTISLYVGPDGYHGVWDCKTCGTDDFLLATPDRDAAIKRCEQLIKLHHTYKHAPVKRQ